MREREREKRGGGPVHDVIWPLYMAAETKVLHQFVQAMPQRAVS